MLGLWHDFKSHPVYANRCSRFKMPLNAVPLNAPTGFLDWVPKKMQRVGCVELLNTVQRRVQPRLHVFGHIHEGEWVGRRGGKLTWCTLP